MFFMCFSGLCRASVQLRCSQLCPLIPCLSGTSSRSESLWASGPQTHTVLFSGAAPRWTLHTSHPDWVENLQIDVTLSVFSHLLQRSSSALDLQLSLDDGYVVFDSNNHKLKSQEGYSDGKWHYLTAVQRPTGWDLSCFYSDSFPFTSF